MKQTIVGGLGVLIMLYLMVQFFYMEYQIFVYEGFFSTLMPWTWIRIIIGMAISPHTLIPFLIGIFFWFWHYKLEEQEAEEQRRNRTF